jgi:chromosome segregation protein
MHLKQLKLAGFKSFVDPTVVSFPSQLVAVLGPNGCGKSNIIDAVRWVMGESSAKNLRGESMTDVIFNGSSNRKPVGQASVELIFDNSLGRLVGPFASYSELSIKRVVTRDGESTYYLNGSRCRRRDVTDVFLGTGAGARGYSIIGQGTISRLIEAKPEEIRTYLEEAAGVSKYKERRRETLQRISHTHDNLSRVADIRDELDKQLQRLERQAKAAERYTLLKEDESLCRAEIMALKWQDFHEQQSGKQKILYDLALRYEEQQSALTQIQTHKIVLNEQVHETNDKAELIHALFYQIGTEVARLEESIQQHQREQKRLEQDRQQMQADWQQAKEQSKLDEEQVLNSQQRAQELQQQVDLVRTDLEQQEVLYQEMQKHGQLCNEQWQEAQNQRNTVKNEVQITQLKRQHSEQNRQQLVLRLEKIHKEKQACSLADLESMQEQLEGQYAQSKEEHLFAEEQFKAENERCTQWRHEVQEMEQSLYQLQNDYHRFNTDYAALSAVQKAALQGSTSQEEITGWLDKPRLLDVLKVDSQWQIACERVLGEDLQAYVLHDFSALWPQWSECERLGKNALTLQPAERSEANRPRLVDKIHGSIPVTVHSLEHIYAAEHIDEAKAWLPDLLPHESIITASGTWLGSGWIKSVSLAEQDEMGLLARQQKIADLALVVENLQAQISKTQTERDQRYVQLQEALKINDSLQHQFNSSTEALRAGTAALDKNKQEQAHVRQLLAGFIIQEEEVQETLEEVDFELVELIAKAASLDLLYQEQEERYAMLHEEKEQQKTSLYALHQTVEDVRKSLHQVELEWDRELTKAQQLNDRIQREEERLIILQERLEHLGLLCTESSVPQLELQERLAEQLLKHEDVEGQLTQSREHLTQIKMELDALEKRAVHHDIEIKQVQELIGQVRMQEQELSVRAAALQESLNESGLKAELLLEGIPQGISQSMREDELLALTEQMKRLGAINLAAIEEFASEQQRKMYLDEQYADLNEALATLQMAIDKMDKETKLRLEHTFDEVNTSFKALFPRLFGGGRAQLELTCDNLLEAGIVVMAQPPGKRNSSIHLLSGGEKAMTAVALVFAIFQLNPSPFCMLDEVDAPLDDVNVGRFCDLVKEMSQFVQFLFITHNKVTMELADHLIGVTMREPGVSRLVAVDVKEALTVE